MLLAHLCSKGLFESILDQKCIIRYRVSYQISYHFYRHGRKINLFARYGHKLISSTLRLIHVPILNARWETPRLTPGPVAHDCRGFGSPVDRRSDEFYFDGLEAPNGFCKKVCSSLGEKLLSDLILQP